MHRETDKLIALHIVGALVKADVPDGLFERREDRPWEPLPYYSAEMDAIWPFYAAKEWILQRERTRWFVFADYRAMEDGLYLGAAESAPLAICRALLESEKMTTKNLQYPGTLEALAAEMRGLCAEDAALLSAVPACLHPALLEFMVGRGMSSAEAGGWIIYGRDLRQFWAQAYGETGLPYGIQTTP